jgi:hypothetical protein
MEKRPDTAEHVLDTSGEAERVVKVKVGEQVHSMLLSPEHLAALVRYKKEHRSGKLWPSLADAAASLLSCAIRQEASDQFDNDELDKEQKAGRCGSGDCEECYPK